MVRKQWAFGASRLTGDPGNSVSLAPPAVTQGVRDES